MPDGEIMSIGGSITAYSSIKDGSSSGVENEGCEQSAVIFPTVSLAIFFIVVAGLGKLWLYPDMTFSMMVLRNGIENASRKKTT